MLRVRAERAKRGFLDALESSADRVPGAAIAVIDDGRVVYERTFGVRALGDPAPVTVSTRFLIASITKPMTTLMEAALVDAGVVGWDTPVVSVLPTFAVGDPEVTRELRLWHMSCACTGMPRQDLEDLFEWDGVTPEARLAAMRTMKPTTKLGTDEASLIYAAILASCTACSNAVSQFFQARRS
jgi:CubicO group peptidase (beta-lactamase class C family)